MADTKIEWADKTWNPITGCSPVSEGCRNCYAARMAKRLAGRCGYDRDEPFAVKLHDDRLNQPAGWRKACKVFVCSMGDFFHDAVTPEMATVVLRMMVDPLFGATHHTYLLLTKRIERLLRSDAHPEYFADYKNVWLGVTAENQEMAEKRIPALLQIPAVVRFVSVEPMLGPVDLTDLVIKEQDGGEQHFDALVCDVDPGDDGPYNGRCLDWVICGAETGPGARPMRIEWALDLLDQCRAAGMPFFFKKASKGDVVPPELMVREWPL
ncbi:MAG: phage Gp37/Gp68 family protein [Desulfobulbaceae bacterium]|nr:phage Gp37/Gp68 family protein [Desulfobulbaceae bacterium]